MANIDFYGLFDYQTGDTDVYEYTATEFNEIYKSITANGVVKGEAEEMLVLLNALNITVKTGTAFIQGRIGKINTQKSLTLTNGATARYDSIILKLDVIGRKITVEIKQGTDIAPPTMIQTSNTWEMELASVLVPKTGTAAVLTDKRAFFYKPTQVMEQLNNVLSGTSYVYAVYA